MPEQGTRLFKFCLPNEKQGIIVFDVSVLAGDQTQASVKLVEYLSEIRAKFFLHRARAVEGSADPKIIFSELLGRLKNISDPIAFILTVHLFTEHWLNHILLKFCPTHDLTDHRYAVKLDMAYGMGKLTDDLFHNLSKLNKLRNQVAHHLDYDITQMDLDYQGCLPDFELKDFRPTLDPSGGSNHISNVLTGVMMQTYGLLHKHCFENLGFRRPD